jgi:surfactin synthase thioesterase subunit
MVDRWVVIGGWGVGAQPLEPIFGPKAVYIDSNLLMPEIVRDGMLLNDWSDLLCQKVSSLFPATNFGIAGWSTGAFFAYALACRMNPDAALFIAATPSFCRRPSFPYGQKELVLRSMREQLAVNPASVLDKFLVQCGIESRIATDRYPPETLTAGLLFLEQATLFPLEPLLCRSLFLHGDSDAIIPARAGEFFANETGGTFAVHPGPHAFFMAQQERVIADITRFFTQGTL